jgi:hypothetical protein
MTRALYRYLLRLHPPAFRRQFAGEMLWIFEECAASRGTLALFLDGVLSLARQWLLRSTGSWKIALAIAGAFLEVSAGGLGGAMISRAGVNSVLAANPFVGHWSGAMRLQNATQAVELTLANRGGAWSGSLTLPQQNGSTVSPVTHVATRWPSISFRVRTGNEVLSFQGRLAPRSQGSRLQGWFETPGSAGGDWELAKQSR